MFSQFSVKKYLTNNLTADNLPKKVVIDSNILVNLIITSFIRISQMKTRKMNLARHTFF